MTTHNTMQDKIGQLATIKAGGIWVEVRIVDAKNSYGIDRVLIEPVAGVGSKWVNFDSLQSVGLPK